MERDEIYLIDMWRILIREWKWFAAMLIVVLAGTFAFMHTAKRQWEATAWIQIGQVGQATPGPDPKVEPLQRVMERLQLMPFQDAVTKSVGFSHDAPDARLYRKSLKIEPLPYAGPLIKLTVRAYSSELANQLATATVAQLQAVHQQLEAMPLAHAHARLDEVQTELRAALAERDRLQQAVASGNKDDAGNKVTQGPLLASVLLATKNEEIHTLQQTKSDLVDRLSSTYTYETSLMWPVYVPDRQAFPNPMLIGGAGVLLGIFLGVLAAVARNTLRRNVRQQSVIGSVIQPKKPIHALTE